MYFNDECNDDGDWCQIRNDFRHFRPGADSILSEVWMCQNNIFVTSGFKSLLLWHNKSVLTQFLV